MKPITLCVLTATLFGTAPLLPAAERHVATTGSDANRGTRRDPLRTIQRASNLAQPGDTITVHAGTYRERVNPPRGGTSEQQRITYQAARGEEVELKGSEAITGWTREHGEVWKVALPNAFFGGFNPYADLIRGDWFNPRGRKHHTGAVYLDGDWLIEAASIEAVLHSERTPPAGDGNYLVNIAWLRPGSAPGLGGRVPANRFSAQSGVQTAACSEGGECVGWIEQGDWISYEGVDFGAGTEEVEIRAASPGNGGLIELRSGTPDGALLGTCVVQGTGDWQVWKSFSAKIKRLNGPQTLCLVFKERPAPGGAAKSAPGLWFAKVENGTTTIWAQFKDVDPNEHLVEINVRQTVFYPDQPGRNFITVRGFAMRHAATPWAPPTAEQIGLIGTHWSKGWIIEQCTISHSTCSGIALGKHGDAFDNTSADTAEGYVKTIERAQAFPIPWTRDCIGGHIVRDNTISHCEQTGIVGSLGSAFCTVTGNTIHDIHVRRLFTGAEMAGIKFHGAIDTIIRGNHIYRTCRGLWLDWMAQGTRVAQNLFHENVSEDLFVEVDHGPFLVENNIFLSSVNLLDMSEGGAYVHNLFTGKINNSPEPNRETPYHPAHSTKVAGLARTTGGDDRFFNNLFIGDGHPPIAAQMAKLAEPRWITSYGPWGYNGRKFPVLTGGNVYYRGATPYRTETAALAPSDFDPNVRLVQDGAGYYLDLVLGETPEKTATLLVTTESLGRTQVAGVSYENPDGTRICVDKDYFGRPRSVAHPTPGPFEKPGPGPLRLRVR